MNTFLIVCIVLNILTLSTYITMVVIQKKEKATEKNIAMMTSLNNLLGKPVYRINDLNDQSYNDPTSMICIPVEKIGNCFIVKYCYIDLYQDFSLGVLDSRFYDDLWADATELLQRSLMLEKELDTSWECDKLHRTIKKLREAGIEIENFSHAQ